MLCYVDTIMESIDAIYFENIFPMKYKTNSSRQEFIEDDISVVMIEQLINLYLKEILRRTTMKLFEIARYKGQSFGDDFII